MSQVVKLNARTFAAVPQIANAVTSIDGYVFVGMPYYDPAGISAVGMTSWTGLSPPSVIDAGQLRRHPWAFGAVSGKS